MECQFNKEEYLCFLDELYAFCDEIRVVNLDDDNEFIKQVFHLKRKHIWTRKFPGYGKESNLNVLCFDVNKEILNILRQYSGFFEIGFDVESEDGVDLAFYKQEELVFHVLNHERMCYIEDKFEKKLNWSALKK